MTTWKYSPSVISPVLSLSRRICVHPAGAVSAVDEPPRTVICATITSFTTAPDGTGIVTWLPPPEGVLAVARFLTAIGPGAGVGVPDGVGVGDAVGTGEGVGEITPVGIGLGVKLGVGLGEPVGTGVGEDVGTGDGVDIGVGEDVGTGVGLLVATGVGVPVGTGVGVAEPAAGRSATCAPIFTVLVVPWLAT